MKYTVLLLYPASMTDGGIQTNQQWVRAKTVAQAIAKARQLVVAEYPGDGLELTAFKVLAVYAGHINDIG